LGTLIFTHLHLEHDPHNAHIKITSYIQYKLKAGSIYRSGWGERRKQWQGTRYNPPKRRISDISYAPCVGKKCGIHVGQGIAASNSI
jgi:hypothetical protein